MNIQQAIKLMKKVNNKIYKMINKSVSILNQKQKRKIILILVCLLINFLLFLAVCSFTDLYFSTNDDYRMRLIVSGNYTGTPSNHAVFMNSFLSNILCFLYQINRLIPWYGILMLSSIFFVSFYLLYSMLRKSKTNETNFACTCLYIGFFMFLTQKHIRELQFSLVSAFFGCCAILGFLNVLNYLETKRKGKSSYFIHCFVFCLSCMMSFAYREKVFYMVIPLLSFILIIKLFKRKFRFKKIVPLLIISLGGVIVLSIGDIYINSQEDFQNYTEFTESRSDLYDYELVPSPYSDHKEFYEKLNITETEYKLLISRTLDVSEKTDIDTYEQVILYGKELKYENFIIKIYNGIAQSIENLTNTIVKYETMFLGFLILLILTLEIYLKKFSNENKILMLGSIIYVFCAVIFFIVLGRIMPRLVEILILYASTIIIYLVANQIALIRRLKFKVRIEKTNVFVFIKSISFIILTALVSACFITSNQYRLDKQENISSINAARLEALNEYASKHPENFYFYNTKDFISSSSLVLEEQKQIVNTDSLGNWYAKSPDYYKRNQMFGFKHAINGFVDNKNVLYACTGKTMNAIKPFFIKKYKKTMKKIDVITDKYNNEVYIYKIIDLGS